MISVVIPTIGRVEILNSVLFSVFQQGGVEEVIILDEADSPVCEHYQVNQALDLLSLKGIRVEILRDRRRKGIGAARWRLVNEARCEHVLMLDDDVVLGKDCLRLLYRALWGEQAYFAIPYCCLVPKLHSDGYFDCEVSRHDKIIENWIEKYPWFLPYFDFREDFIEDIHVSGTQAILVLKSKFLSKCSGIMRLGDLPREDTYLTSKLNHGVFVSRAKCYHFEHDYQQERKWSSVMFYRLHEKIMENPDMFKEFIG